MYDIFTSRAKRFTGAVTFPELPYLRRCFDALVDDVRHYYYRHPKRVDSDNLFGRILLHLPRRWDLDDRRYRRYIEDTAPGVTRAMGLTSTTYRGRVHEGGITLGPKSHEAVLSVMEPIDVRGLEKHWMYAAPLTYLYHSRLDLQLPIMNNTTPGKATGVCTLDVPLLALQYRHWLLHQHRKHQGDQKESVFRFIGSIVLPNAVTSFVDIAFFNRLARIGRDIGNPKFPAPHPFYVTDYSRRVDTLCEKIIETQARRSGDLEQVVDTTPLLYNERLWDIMRLPKDPVTRQNEWALQLARLPYVRYLVDTAVQAHQGDRAFLSEIYHSLREARMDNTFARVASNNQVKDYHQQIDDLMATLDGMGHGYG